MVLLPPLNVQVFLFTGGFSVIRRLGLIHMLRKSLKVEGTSVCSQGSLGQK